MKQRGDFQYKLHAVLILTRIIFEFIPADYILFHLSMLESIQRIYSMKTLSNANI